MLFDDGRSSACDIMELSIDGARVRLPDAAQLPDKLWLINVSNWLAHEVTVIWRKTTTAGVSFHSSRDLRDPQTDRDRALHELCVQLSAR